MWLTCRKKEKVVWMLTQCSQMNNWTVCFLGSFSEQVLGLGCVAQVVTGQGAFGHFLSINIGFGLAVAMGVHIGGNISGK